MLDSVFFAGFVDELQKLAGYRRGGVRAQRQNPKENRYAEKYVERVLGEDAPRATKGPVTAHTGRVDRVQILPKTPEVVHGRAAGCGGRAPEASAGEATPRPTPRPQADPNSPIQKQLADPDLPAKMKAEYEANQKAKAGGPAKPVVRSAPAKPKIKMPKPHKPIPRGLKIGLGVGAGVGAAALGGYLYHQHKKFKAMEKDAAWAAWLEKISMAKWKGMFGALGGQMQKAKGSFGAMARQHAGNLERAAVNPAQHAAEMRNLGSMRRISSATPATTRSDLVTSVAERAHEVSPASQQRTFGQALGREGKTYTGGPTQEQLGAIGGHPGVATRSGARVVDANDIQHQGTSLTPTPGPQQPNRKVQVFQNTPQDQAAWANYKPPVATHPTMAYGKSPTAPVNQGGTVNLRAPAQAPARAPTTHVGPIKRQAFEPTRMMPAPA